jgi:dTDP-4-amino-4,6-dideoxygalactose transaminase
MILLNDFKRQYAETKEQIDSAVSRVLESGWYVMGSELESFEKEFAGYIGVPYCVGVASGTEAIALALMALGIGEGDEVITTCFTAFPTITGIMQAGATPVLVDVNPEDGLIDTGKVEQKITKKTKAIMPVHLYGQSCDMTELVKIADSHGLFLVEDCAQSVGATYNGEKTGSFGICSAFSFYPTKNLGAVGDAGAVTTGDKNIYEKLKSLRNYGQTVRYYHDYEGINSRMDEIQAAILRAKLQLLDKWNARRREIASVYTKNLVDYDLVRENSYGESCYHLFVIRCDERESLISFLQKRSISALIHYPVPVNRQKAFLHQKEEAFPGTEKLSSTVLSIPIYPELYDEEIKTIISALHEFKR